MTTPELIAEVALTVGPDGTWHEQKNPTTPWTPASITKILNAVTARKLLAPERLDETVSYHWADSGSTALLQVGDIVTWRDLFYGMMLPSGNDAARAVARWLGQELLGTTGTPGNAEMTRYVAEMNTVAVDDLGWTNHEIYDPAGVDNNNRVTMQQWCELLVHILDTDTWLINVMGTISHEMTATGPNARTWTINHTVNPTASGGVPMTEFYSGKTGSTGGGAGMAILWTNPIDGQLYATALQGSTSAARWTDVRALMDARIAATEDPNPDPDQDPFQRAGRFLIRGGLPMPADVAIWRGGAPTPVT